ncbi:type 1 glutamine amidotransferase domain-containing protein [Aquihabitans sp. McL0605]|uniref:type 1 glutamine amidotransferase domain-containing protein n=1 Tax=Aquihabitans sp. McL0605 TaxID=3415671 RepID=UPI003CF36607
MANDRDLTGMHIAFLATDGVEQVELTGPWDAVKEAGAAVDLISTVDEVQGFRHLDQADTFPADEQVAKADAADYDALVLPGGVANPDALRMDDDAMGLVRSFAASGKLVAAICHAPWLLAEANLIEGRTVTSWPSLQTDLRNAGANWVDQEVVVDTAATGTLITSRNPDDIPAFSEAIITHLATSGTR